LEDIAAKAGVSRSTVSRVINNNPLVSEKTRQKVLAIIEQEGFSPNAVARALVTRRTNVIGIVVPLVPEVLFADAYYFPALLHGISETANAHGYSILLWFGQSDDDEIRFHNRIITNRLMDGVVIASACQNYPLIDHFLESDTPFVLVERPANHNDQINYVTINNFAVAHTLVSHLISLGRKRIGVITGNLAIADGIDRFEGYKQALVDANHPIDENLIFEGDFTYDCGYKGIKALLAHNIDAVFAANDITARGVVQALEEEGIRVPQDVAIVSVDNLPTAVQAKPPLTTVHHPIKEKGAYAAKILFDLIEDEETVPQQILLPTQLIVRESCGASLT
jgi:LacI family transcriptional regulator